MATKYKMTWLKDRRWLKKHRGTRKTWALRQGESKEASYYRIWPLCRAWMADLDQQHDDGSAIATRSAWQPIVNVLHSTMQDIITRHGDTETTRLIYKDLQQTFGSRLIEASVNHGDTPGDDADKLKEMITEHAEALQRIHWQPPASGSGNLVVTPDVALGTPPWEVGPDGSGSLRQLVDRFIESVKVDAGLGRARNLRRYVDDFLKSLPADVTIEVAFSGAMLADYLEKVKSSSLAKSTMRDKVASVKQLATWLYEREHLDSLPRLIVANKFKAEASEGDPDPYDADDVKAILAASSGRARLYILMSINTGMTQQDIADLAPHEVDWEAGKIIRKRSKTSDKKNVPTVSWTQWPETFELLCKYKSKDPNRVIVNAQGEPLVLVREVGEKTRRTDAVAKTMSRLRDKMKRKDPITFKRFRSTAASMLEEHEIYGRYVDHFLGHAPSSIAAKHYVRPSQDQFDKAVAWLRTSFGIDQL